MPNAADAHSLSFHAINTILQEDNGIVWVGTAAGLNKLNPIYLKFEKKIIATDKQKEYDLHHPENILLQKDNNGNTNYWFSYWYGEGLVKTDTNFNILKHIIFKHWDKPLPFSSHVSNVFIGNGGNLWIATWDGLWSYDVVHGKLLKNYKLNMIGSSQPKISKFDYAAEDKEGNIWVGTYSQGLYELNPTTGIWKKYPQGDGPLETKSSRCDFLFLDSKNRMWLSDISYYDFAKKQFVKPVYEPSSAANNIIEDKKHNIWLATETGIAKYNESTNDFTIYGVNDGIASSAIQSIALDTDDNIWAVTLNGLNFLDTKTNSIRTFGINDALLMKLLGKTLQLLPNGKMMLNYLDGKESGFLLFSPQEMLAEKKIPFHFTSFNVLGKELNFDKSLDSISKIEVSYKENSVAISFKALAFADNINIRYRYRLNNIDDDKWIDLGRTSSITFSDLRGGKYQLEIQATNINGTWMENSLHLKIIVQPPFWFTWWFIGMMAVLLGLIALYFIRRRIQSIKTRAEIKQQVTALEMKALKAQMNPHFVFNSLSSIQDSIVHGKTEAASKYLGKFSKLIRAVLENSDKKFISLQQEIDYLQLYLELESFRFDDFTFTIHAVRLDDLSFIKIPAMLVQPFVENAIKHGLSHKEGDKHLSIIFSECTNDLLQVVVEDNGIGRQQSAIINQTRLVSHQSMGMKITHERLSLQDQWSKQNIRIEDLLNNQAKSIGTRVTIYINLEK
jgi:ligand-binding sensor domain-containing protein